MPKSKRDKKVSLTNTAKKGLQSKQKHVEEIRKCVDEYERIFVYSLENSRNTTLKELRGDWKDSRFFFGKTKVMRLALGRSKEEEVQNNLHKLAKTLVGQCGLLFTNRPKEEVADFFESYSAPDFARSGFKATEDVILPEGPLPDFSFSLEPQLRKLGMPTSLQKGVITLLQEYKVCKKGSVLTPEQAQILTLLGKQMAEFRVTLKCAWNKDNGKITKLKSKSKNGNNGEDNFSLRMEADEEIGDDNGVESDENEEMDDDEVDDEEEEGDD